MRIAFIILLALHGTIHLFGFLKALELSGFETILTPVSKTQGFLWLTASLLFFGSGLTFFFKQEYWWLLATLAIIVSQLLIFQFWTDAKFGTFANFIILLAVAHAYFDHSFKEMVANERAHIFEAKTTKTEILLDTLATKRLPEAVSKWLSKSGALSHPPISSVHLNQNLQLQLKPDQTKWITGRAEQFFTIDPPAFIWTIDSQMNAFLPLVGRDKFQNGQGEMLIKLLSAIPVADAKGSDKVNQATLQRFLAEIVWFPSAALEPSIKWESLGQNSARATMSFAGTSGSGDFYFQENGDFQKFEAMRFQDAQAAQPTKWIIEATKIEELNDIRIPTACQVSWDLSGEKWTWLKLRIEDIRYESNTE